MKNTWVIFIFLTLLYISNGHPAIASEVGPFQGRIVDVETKQSLEGVVVLMEWRQVHFFAGSTFIDAQEALTDKEGKFHLPGIWIFNPWKRLNTEAHIRIYKSGYGSTSAAMGQMEGMLDALLEIEWGAPKGTFIWKLENGKPVFILKKLTVEERRKYGTGDEPAVSLENYHQVKRKWELLRKERNKEMRFWGIGEDIDSDGFGR